MDEKKRGKLYIVATPIGNLKDITLRALDVLREVDYILCEDTRVCSKLLTRYEIFSHLKSFYKEREFQAEEKILNDLKVGSRIALVSDAGTPLISDPGYHLVKKTLDAGIEVDSIPGPSAVINALVLSGFSPVPFTFLGYIPRGGEERKRFFEILPFFDETVVVFETPHRIRRTLVDLANVIPEREVAVIREMTKVNQEIIRSRAGELLEKKLVEKGELTIVIAPGEKDELIIKEIDIEQLKKNFKDTKELIHYLKWRTGLPRNKLYKIVKKMEKY